MRSQAQEWSGCLFGRFELKSVCDLKGSIQPGRSNYCSLSKQRNAPQKRTSQEKRADIAEDIMNSETAIHPLKISHIKAARHHFEV